MRKKSSSPFLFLFFILPFVFCFSQNQRLKIFISVDMEGIGGIGTAHMVNSSGKDYATGRQLMTDEVNSVIEAIKEHGPAEILINDSHGDMQNLLHIQLPEDVEYIQGNIKPLGMVQGLDDSFDAAIFIGYHSRAGTENGFLAHTGSGAVKGLWVNGVEVGEAGMNAFYAGALGVPVIMASGDKIFADQFGQLVNANLVVTKEAVTSVVAKLVHPAKVRQTLKSATKDALSRLNEFRPLEIQEPVTVRMKFGSTTRGDIAEAIPFVKRIDGYTFEFQTQNMTQAYKMIRLMYKFISW